MSYDAAAENTFTSNLLSYCSHFLGCDDLQLLFLGDNAKHLIVPGSSEGQFTSFQYSTNFICLGLRVLVGQDKTFEDITSFITNTTQKSLFVACLHLDMIVCRNYNYYIIFYNKYRSLDL